MKRSEMLKKLCEPIKIEGIDLMLWPDEAEAILRRIEELGMLPPLYNRNEGSGMPSCEVNEWETE